MHPYSVSELNREIKDYIIKDGRFNNVCVVGEISNYKLYPSGHHYFSMKDENSQIKCVMFKGDAFSLRFKPQNGMLVMAVGKIDVFERDGVYQFYCKMMAEQGAGDLQAAFERLKAKLEKEHLFDESHKKRLPRFPDKIAVITSPVGAAVRDIIRILGVRWPLSKVIVIPVKVQGVEAPGELAEAIHLVNENKLADVIITGRGGGSIEDLWAFNDEKVARAIYNSEIPVISAVGHEPDVTISDYVADVRASTPSNAAEICVPDQREICNILSSIKLQMDPGTYINNMRMNLDSYHDRLLYSVDRYLYSKRHSLSSLSSSFEAMSPTKVLDRGYCITLKDNQVINSSEKLLSGDLIQIKFSDGNVNSTVV